MERQDYIDQTKVKSEHLDGERAKRENYTGTHGTPEFIADLAADIYQLHTPNYREGI